MRADQGDHAQEHAIPILSQAFLIYVTLGNIRCLREAPSGGGLDARQR